MKVSRRNSFKMYLSVGYKNIKQNIHNRIIGKKIWNENPLPKHKTVKERYIANVFAAGFDTVGNKDIIFFCCSVLTTATTLTLTYLANEFSEHLIQKIWISKKNYLVCELFAVIQQFMMFSCLKLSQKRVTLWHLWI